VVLSSFSFEGGSSVVRDAFRPYNWLRSPAFLFGRGSSSFPDLVSRARSRCQTFSFFRAGILQAVFFPFLWPLTLSMTGPRRPSLPKLFLSFLSGLQDTHCAPASSAVLFEPRIFFCGAALFPGIVDKMRPFSSNCTRASLGQVPFFFFQASPPLHGGELFSSFFLKIFIFVSFSPLKLTLANSFLFLRPPLFSPLAIRSFFFSVFALREMWISFTKYLKSSIDRSSSQKFSLGPDVANDFFPSL